MVDVFLLICVLVIVGGAIFANVRILQYYQQPEDSGFGGSVFCKVIIVAALTLAWLLNILLPVDVRNSRPVPGIVDMQIVWKVAYFTLAGFILLIVPAAMFYTEVEGDDVIKKKRRYVICNMLALLFFSCCAIAISYPFLSNASFPVIKYDCGSWLDGDAKVAASGMDSMTCASSHNASMELKVGFDVYIIAVMCWVGWLFFVVFGGIGLSAVPLDLILAFADRPVPISEQTYQQSRKMLGQAASILVARAEVLQEKDGPLCHEKGWRAARKKRALRTEYNKFKRDVLLLEGELERLTVSKFHKGESLAVSVLKLIFGILCAIVSIMWVLHIILCVMMKQIDKTNDIQFIGAIFAACETPGLYPLGVALFAFFTLYLLACVIKGCLKFGMRVFFLFSIHPMRHQATPLNSMLFNIEMVLLTSAAVCQFALIAFPDYARLTDADVIFSAQVKYMTFYSFFFENNIFVYTLLFFFLVAFIYLMARPRDNAQFRPDAGAEKQLASIIGAAMGKKEKDLQDKAEKKSLPVLKKARSASGDSAASLL